MVQKSHSVQPTLYESDETAWLEHTAELIRAGRYEECDRENLVEYLTDMARRDRREVKSRLIVLLVHLLKWQYQPERRSTSWLLTIYEQQREMQLTIDSGTLRNHAVDVMANAYTYALKEAAAETGLARTSFPDECPWDVDSILADLGEAG
jgi:hypothetical protein